MEGSSKVSLRTSGTWNLSSRVPNRAVSHPNLMSLEEKPQSLHSSDEIKQDLEFPDSDSQDSPRSFDGKTEPPPRMDVPIHPPSIKKEANAEVYGFVGWVASFFAFGLYLVWAFLPDHLLHELGVSYYPDKWWAIAFPSIMCVSITSLMWVTYASLNLLNTPSLNSLDYFTSDEDATESNRAPIPGGIDPISDLPLTKVNALLYNQTRRHKKSRSSQLFHLDDDEL